MAQRGAFRCSARGGGRATLGGQACRSAARATSAARLTLTLVPPGTTAEWQEGPQPGKACRRGLPTCGAVPDRSLPLHLKVLVIVDAAAIAPEAPASRCPAGSRGGASPGTSSQLVVTAQLRLRLAARLTACGSWRRALGVALAQLGARGRCTCEAPAGATERRQRCFFAGRRRLEDACAGGGAVSRRAPAGSRRRADGRCPWCRRRTGDRA